MPVDLSPLPVPLSGEWSYNASPSIQDNIVTVDDAQLCVFVAAAGRPTIARRRLPGDQWDVFDLGCIPGNPLRAPIAADGHNFLSMALDADGFIHVSGNHHDDPLRYVRSLAPFSIDRWHAPGMTGMDEQSVTYPKYFQLPDGSLFFCHRTGTAGRGDLVLNRYGDGHWTRLCTLVDGTSTDESFYPNHIATRDGAIHVMGVWRRTNQAASTNDCSYACSRDGGRNWERADGSRQPIPITHENSLPVIRTREGSGLLNGGGLEVDMRGTPHGALLMNDAHGTQVHHIAFDGRWCARAVTRLTHTMVMRGGYADGAVAHPAVVTTSEGRILFVYRTTAPGRPRGIRIADADDAEFERILLDVDLEYWNPTFDTRALYERDELHMLLVRTANPHDPTVTSSTPRDSERASVLTLQLGRVDELQRVPKND